MWYMISLCTCRVLELIGVNVETGTLPLSDTCALKENTLAPNQMGACVSLLPSFGVTFAAIKVPSHANWYFVVFIAIMTMLLEAQS